MERKDLSKELISWDTGYELPNGDYREYILPTQGKLIVLLLSSVTMRGVMLWTTIRKWTKEKEQLYINAQNDEEEIELHLATRRKK